MGENSLSRGSLEEVTSIDDGAAGSSYSTIPFSKKAIHQRDADENLFLRFLELDPIPDSTTASSASGTTTTITNTIANSSGPNAAALLAEQQRKKSCVRPSNGRTPFTITKKLIRENDNRGYGFSIVWTHPPRVEKVEPGLTAEKCGIIPGDFVIFVDKHNVVTMPELDILNLIKSQGNTLLLEIYRRSSTKPSNGLKSRNSVTISSNQMMVEQATPKQSTIALEPRPSTAYSNTTYSMETTKRRLHLPQVTFSKESIAPHSLDDVHRRFLYQLINSEQHFVTAIQYGMQRFVAPLQERSDLISQSDHRTLFQNLEEILRLSEDILEQLVTEDQDPQLNFASRLYVSKSTTICAAYKRYCNGLKRADCVLVNKSRNSNSDFVTFITVPQVPRKRPDLTSFIHRPLQHIREILKLNLMLASHCRPDTDEFRNFTTVVNAFQSAYREITVSEGLMEPLGEGRPLLTLQDLEARLVFTKCKPFTLSVPGRQWVFGGDLSRVEGRSVKPYWTLLFSDIIVFAKVSRDRVLFITEEPLSLINIVDSCFNIRKKTTEFRITVDPNGRLAESPTAHCAPDLSRTPRKNSRRRVIILRTPSPELKAVWQNLLQRQIVQVNAALGSSLSSPIDSPDIMQTFIPLSDIGAATTSMASIKLSSDSVYLRNQQNKSTKVSKQVEEIIDEKCRILNKTGTARGSAIHHLSLWMKGQLDCVPPESEDTNEPEPEEEQIEEWSRDQLIQRSKELQLIDENGKCKVPKLDVSERSSDRVEEISLSEVEDESKSASRSTTSDSQTTVRSSPIANNDKISVCRHCHKNCKSKLSQSTSNSLKVQHGQSSPNRCCQSPTSSSNSQTSISTLTGSANHSQLSNCDKISRTSLLNGSGSERDTKCNEADKRSSASSNNNQPCNCKCDPDDFKNTLRSSQELRKETCKIINSVAELNLSPKSVQPNHSNCKCSCDEQIEKRIAEGKFDKDADDWSLMLIGLAQIHPTTALVQVDPFEALPTISVVPPTPEGIYSKLSSSLLWDNSKLSQDDARQAKDQNKFDDEVSPEDSPQDEEPPYRTLKTGLKRYGTMSSLEKVSSEDTDDKTLNSSDEEYDDDDIKIVTKEVFTSDGKSQNWTNRAGSFLEQSRAFFDSYLGRWDRSNGEDMDETIDDCTSGATSGEDVWGTPTSGENDEIQMFNSDQTHSSPTKSSSSLTCDDDTELMMDELLMAPPMTASSIRGLLPRRRLEPLFEEDTESGNSDEDNLPPDCSSSDQIKLMLGNSYESDIVIDGALLLCSLHNGSVELTKQNLKSISGAQVCSNSFPILLLAPKKIDVGLILQIISKQRSEHCCLTLISCLLQTCKPEFNSTNESDTSSVEILKALTFHLASPLQKQSSDVSPTANPMAPINRSKSAPLIDTNKLNSEIPVPVVLSDSECNDPVIKFFDKMADELNNPGNTESLFHNNDDKEELLEQLIANEENYIANILLKCLKFCPSSFDKQPSKAEVIKWVNRGTSKLWAQVGSTLEHIVLWWSDAPLACRPVACAKYLRDWLLIIQPEDAPEPILSTLRGLGETLTVYVTGTTWDKQFRLTLVSSVLPVNYNFENTEFHCSNDQLDGTTTGRLWSELLYSLTTFCNSCDQKGTIPNELPIVEQIPILHRLDHSVHTMRLWAAYKAKELCTEWNKKMFFKVVYNDVNHCLEQLNELRVPELVPADSFEVLVQVCVALRAKLVSEVKVNVNKLKQTYGECIEVLASICQTISLATLTLCFPAPKLWQSDLLQDNANDYVTYYLNQLYLPVLQATHILEILSLILKLLCEAWLDHIYMKKIKFSRPGAMNLLKDFDGVSQWILSCNDIQKEHIEILARHEVLRMCEGVGKILLRKPDEVISMMSEIKLTKAFNEEEEERAPLPPEMFVPNQQRWLELRARNTKSSYCLCLCNDTKTIIED